MHMFGQSMEVAMSDLVQELAIWIPVIAAGLFVGEKAMQLIGHVNRWWKKIVQKFKIDFRYAFMSLLISILIVVIAPVFNASPTA